MKRGWLNIWASAILALAAFGSQAVQAQGLIQVIQSGKAVSERDPTFRKLLAAEGQDLNWPAFPRTWHEQSVGETLSSNTSAGLKLAGIKSKVEVDYRWGIKTSLVILASHRGNKSVSMIDGVTENQVSQDLDQKDDRFEIFRWDEKKRRTFPNVRPEYPMVAFCAFEASLGIVKSLSGGIEFLGFGQSLDSQNTRSITHTLFSKFFQIDGTKSVQQILNETCLQKFKGFVENFVNKDFSKSVVEYFAYEHPKNQCQPSSEVSISGDESCFSWHQTHFAGVLGKMTVPRCVLHSDGIHRCQVLAKENVSCPMHWNRKKQAMVLPSQEDPFAPKATAIPLEFPCDTDQGLTCTPVAQPKVLFGTPIWPGVARCQR